MMNLKQQLDNINKFDFLEICSWPLSSKGSRRWYRSNGHFVNE